MTDNVYVYIVDLPVGITEMVTPCLDGYTIYLNAKVSAEAQRQGYLHALYHIRNNDFEREGNIQVIESQAHKNAPRYLRP